MYINTSVLAAHRYALPRALREYKVVCAGADKPLVAAALLAQLAPERTVVFTASVEATRRCVARCLPGVPGMRPARHTHPL